MIRWPAPPGAQASCPPRRAPGDCAFGGSRRDAGRLLALALEGLPLGLATALPRMQAALGRRRTLLMVASIGPLFVRGGVVGAAVPGHFSAPAVLLVLAFALAALLFLVTEELLAEAHKTPDVPLVTALFFVGFVLFLILGMREKTVPGVPARSTNPVRPCGSGMRTAGRSFAPPWMRACVLEPRTDA